MVGLTLDWAPLRDWLLSHGLRILLIALTGLILYWLLRRTVPRAMRAAMVNALRDRPPEEVAKRSQTLAGVATTSGAAVILVAASFTILAELGINIAPVLAGAGIVGVAVGFGAQSLVRDVLSGFFILMENQYSTGDMVSIAGVSGLVEEVTLRRTVLRDLDGTVHSIPNGEIRVASNLTREWSRIDLNLRVGHNEDTDRVVGVVDRVGQELAHDDYFAPFILEPPRFLRVEGLEGAGVVLKISGVTKPSRQGEVLGELRRRLKKAFDQERLSIT